MKKRLLLVATLLSVTALASCDDPNTSNTSSQELNAWTSEQVDEMVKCVGFELPFFALPEGAEQFSSDEEKVFGFSVEGTVEVDYLKEVETAFKADPSFTIDTALGSEDGYPSYALYVLNDAVTIDENDYVGYIQMGLYTNEDDFGQVTSGSLEIAAFLELQIEDKSAAYDTYAEAAQGVVAYFADYNIAVVTPTSLTTSATSFELIDMRAMYYNGYGLDLGPYVSLYLNEAKEAEVDAVVKAFTDIGYVESQYTYDGETYTEYVKDSISVEVDYYAADEDFSEAVVISFIPASEE